MSSDEEALRTLNVQINDAENDGNTNFLASILAPELAFSRANKTVDDAGRYLQQVPTKASPKRELARDLIEVKAFGNRAIVMCEISQSGKNYHNIRLFVRVGTDWKLLGWANEEWVKPGLPRRPNELPLS